jgi:hypothetical protein
MEPELVRVKRARHRRRSRLREIDRRLKIEYQANKATHFSPDLCELLEKIEVMQTGAEHRAPS